MNETLNESARKAKRNLWIFASLSWILATGLLSPVEEGAKISIGGIGLETSIAFIFVALFLVLTFNLINLRLHGKFGEAWFVANRIAEEINREPVDLAIHRKQLHALDEHKQVGIKYGRILSVFDYKIPFYFGVSGLVIAVFGLLREVA